MTAPESLAPTPTAAVPAVTIAAVDPPVTKVSWREPLFAWFVSRVVCMVAIVLGGALFPVEKVYDLRKVNPNAGVQADLPAFFQSYAEGFRDLKRFGNKPMIGILVGGQESWLRPFVHWDAVWWLCIAEVWYVADPQLKAEQNVVFYPLFPLCIRALNRLGIPMVLSAMLIVNGLMLVVTYLLYRLVARRSGLAAARWTLAFWLTFPSAFFGVVPYSEALLALFSVLVMQSLLEQKYITSGLWSGLASAIKNQGVIIGGALVVPLLTGPSRGRAFIGLMCSGLGLLAYMGFMYFQYGDPLFFVAVQKAWRPKLGNPYPWNWFLGLIASSVQSLLLLLKSNSKPIDFYGGRILDPWLGWWMLLWVPAVRRLHWGLVLSSAVMILLPLSTGTIASLGRYVWIILPIFVVMGERLARSGWRWPIVLVSTCGLLWQAFLFGGGWEVI